MYCQHQLNGKVGKGDFEKVQVDSAEAEEGVIESLAQLRITYLVKNRWGIDGCQNGDGQAPELPAKEGLTSGMSEHLFVITTSNRQLIASRPKVMYQQGKFRMQSALCNAHQARPYLEIQPQLEVSSPLEPHVDIRLPTLIEPPIRDWQVLSLLARGANSTKTPIFINTKTSLHSSM